MPFIPAGFPDYVYRPYPKFLILADGTQAIADNAEHEAELTGTGDATDERAKLFAEAEAKGITVDRRWGVDKLKAALA